MTNLKQVKRIVQLFIPSFIFDYFPNFLQIMFKFSNYPTKSLIIFSFFHQYFLILINHLLLKNYLNTIDMFYYSTLPFFMLMSFLTFLYLKMNLKGKNFLCYKKHFCLILLLYEDFQFLDFL